MENCSCYLSKEVLGDLFILAVVRVELSEGLATMLLKVSLYEFVDLLVFHISFLLEIPLSYLSKVC